ncbi:GntR family transcriptional regulator [Sulfobacillus harzensis]|uniref:GntR family transcriptional regulator n=1 Tax=Sulfobacillus harzensis TaxID=2729629 RepID=A0A7Y0L467_9FIRM|nr:GntR family transcriptional regulator [Sulfobacillus harzensis]NMP22915.1 GntR family transcriptional regulator [Sulfobacillus harzensis]
MANRFDGERVRSLSRDEVLAECRRRLVQGAWRPGDVVQEKILAEELGVSKTPVREALQYLTFVGMVKPYSRIGYVISPIELQDIIEVFQFRTLIEDDLIQTVAALPDMTVPAGQSEEMPAITAEIEFHRTLYARVAKPRMASSLEVLLDQTARALNYTQLDDELMRSIAHEHEAIILAVRHHDAPLARAHMTVHLRHLRDSLLSKLRQQLRETKNIL